jgi:predicted dehydrogenase
MSRVVRVGVIGCGAIAEHLHIPDLIHAPETEVVALCDIRRAAAERLATALAPEAAIYTDHAALLRDPKVEAVVIGLPNALHAPVAIAAAKAGKHVLVEKPMATSLAECKAMIAAAKKAGVHLLVNQCQRLARHHLKAKEVIDSGLIGKILSVSATFGHSGPDNWSPDGKWFFQKKLARFGAMADLGVHKADIIRFLTGKEVVEVAGFYGTLDKKRTDVDDNFVSAIKFSDGTLGTLSASWTAYGKGVDYIYIHGTNGTLRVNVYPDQLVVADVVKPEAHIVFDLPPPRSDYPGSWELGVGSAFGRAILGLEPPFCSGEEGMRSLALILAAEQAADTGKAAKVKV